MEIGENHIKAFQDLAILSLQMMGQLKKNSISDKLAMELLEFMAKQETWEMMYYGHND